MTQQKSRIVNTGFELTLWQQNPRFASAEYDDLSTFPIRLVPLGSELTHGESDEYARLVAGVAPPHSTPSGTAATTPIVTPGTPNGNTTGGPATEPDVAEPSRKVVKDMQKRGKAHFESDADEDTSAHTPVPATATKPGPARKRARFAD